MVDGGVKGLFIDYGCVQRLIIEIHVSNILICPCIYDEIYYVGYKIWTMEGLLKTCTFCRLCLSFVHHSFIRNELQRY